MRNPWGHGGEWSGNWGDKSELWTPELRQQCGATDQDDGMFFMTVEDNYSIFEWFSWTMYTATPKMACTPIKQKEYAYIKFTLTKNLDLSKNVLSFMMARQGNRIGMCRPDEKQMYRNGAAYLTILSESGEVIEKFEP